jgi:SAM-dependent methyltransferase
MPIENCRICGRLLPVEPLLRYSNMPKSAQFMPEAATLGSDNGIDLDIRQCTGCGTVQLTNDPVPYHREVIRASAFSNTMRAFRKSQFLDFIARYSLEGKKIIEIGCGRGEFMRIMNECGAKAYGLEYAEDSVQSCIEIGLRTFKGYVESPDWKAPEAPFDAFYVLNFLEHMPDPNLVLSGICNSLREGAVGLVEVPNFDMILRTKLFSEFISDHLFYFTRDSLNCLLSLNGFEIIDTGEVWHEYIISSVVRKRGKPDVADFGACLARVRAQIEAFVASFGDGRVAIWGAGHQALTMIAMAGLAGKIRYVVDSAPFKQGRYTPATHIPIVSPRTLESDPVDAIVVMAASYSDEVAGLIRQEHGNKMSVAILRDSGLEIYC